MTQSEATGTHIRCTMLSEGVVVVFILISPGAEGLDMNGAEFLQPLLVCVRQRLYVCWGAGVW